MGAFISFPTVYVAIDGGTVVESTNPQFLGSYRYFVDFIDQDGGCIGVWDGTDHEDAVLAADEWAADFNCPVIDKCRGVA